MHSQSNTFCRWRSAESLLGEGQRNRCTQSQHCAVTDEVNRKTIIYFSLFLLLSQTADMQSDTVCGKRRHDWCSNIQRDYG